MRYELKILLTASAFAQLAAGLFGPIYAIFVEEIGGDLLAAGGAYGIFALIAGALTFVVSRWEDSVQYKEWLIVAGYGIGALGILGYLFVKSPIDLFIVQGMLGVSEAIGAPAFDGLYSRYLDKGRFVSEWGLWESMAWITTGVAAIIGGWMAQSVGFRALFVSMFALSLISVVTSFALTRKSRLG